MLTNSIKSESFLMFNITHDIYEVFLIIIIQINICSIGRKIEKGIIKCKAKESFIKEQQ